MICNTCGKGGVDPREHECLEPPQTLTIRICRGEQMTSISLVPSRGQLSTAKAPQDGELFTYRLVKARR